MSVPLLCSAFDFYSRPCGRGDVHRPASAHHLAISTHAPAGGATRRLIHVRLVTNISTHAPAGGATLASTQTSDKSSNFYSRPCGRGDPACSCAQPDLPISTHAPAGGATVFDEFSVSDDARRFLLTPLREGRHDRALLYEMPKIISTHAPAGGATSSRNPCVCTGLYFYSRPCGRGDRTERSACF